MPVEMPVEVPVEVQVEVQVGLVEVPVDYHYYLLFVFYDHRDYRDHRDGYPNGYMVDRRVCTICDKAHMANINRVDRPGANTNARNLRMEHP